MTSVDSVTATKSVKTMPLLTLSAMVVGSMVGAGVFSLPGRFATTTGGLGALISWAIAGTGMLMLAFVFQNLALRKPDLDAGVYAYAKAGFGEYLGFFSAFGYWASACVGNVSYWVLVKSTLGQVLPIFGEGNTIWAVLLSTVGIWAFHFMVLRGVQEAASINKIVTVAKLVPILVFIVISLFYFKWDVFTANFSGGNGYSESLFSQISSTMTITVFVFLGIEGASVYSRYARKREDVGRATVLGFLSVLAIFASVTMVAYGIMPRADLAGLQQPSMAPAFEASVGTWGAWFISIGVIVSVMGAYLAWTLMASEVLFVAAKDRDMPSFLSRVNTENVPLIALLFTSALVQLVLLTTLFSDDAFGFTLHLCTALSLIPYLGAAGYALKLAATRETYDEDGPGIRTKELVVAAVATFYTVFLIYAAGLEFLLLSCIIYAPGTILFALTRREQGKRLFSAWELLLFIIVAAGAVAGIAGLATGWITI
ncbi:amino acid permease [Rhodococcus sp. D2-41]|uniref:Basic amino acid/polyamine antiporter n=1 Tax=Speluncibacter jeojiensis TaxID=2710754 RepID=A0A9X4LXM9_9ACTN|nr:basic amino acid/polyamine antiporter [Rhodococcus sp. D2-41]MDG3010437.1 amino acid permease [Rhodococcus sp. D2-41]MDG3014184.1 basic amino acid/polyamine antiporter [Corynebacteriales bacterium D3-21]